MKQSLATLFLILAVFSFAPSAQAATEADSDLQVRMESPATPTRLNTWKLAFTTVDRLGRAINVQCFVKKPTGGFAQFDLTKTFAAGVGGGSNSCQVNSSVMSEQGTYEFYVTADAGSGVDMTDSAFVLYDSDGPGTPTGYNKEHPSECRWIIRFHTASDGGLTQKVEIYSSDQPNFDTHPGTRVGTVSIGSNADGEFIHDRGTDCNKTWYYVIRAFDSIGNQSGHIGDSFTTTTTVPGASAPASGALIVPLNQGNILGQTDDSIQDGEVIGEATPASSTDGQGTHRRGNGSRQRCSQGQGYLAYYPRRPRYRPHRLCPHPPKNPKINTVSA